MTPTPTSAVAARELAEQAKLLAFQYSHERKDATCTSELRAALETEDKLYAVIDHLRAALAAQPAAPAVLAEPVAHVVEPYPSGANYLAWYSNKAMFNTPAGTKLFDHPASQARSPLTEWQPIETAPKDGTEVLLWREDCGQFIGSYTSGDNFPLTQEEIDMMAEEVLFAKDWFTQWPDARRLEGSELPDLWQPLPLPPSGIGSATTEAKSHE